jgi:4-amino-4-deoxy-L-arabinose transferase-like glycosyltransferase
MTARSLGIWAMAGVSLCAGVLLLWHLNVEPLQNYDEATYAQVARESLQNHSFLTPTYADKPYLEKPPLAIWLIEKSEQFIQNPEIAVRLPSALAALTLIFVVMLFAAEVSGNLFIGALAGAILTTSGAFIEAARQARVDMVLVLCITLAVYFFWKGMHRGHWFLPFGVSLGAAIMTKNVIAGFALIGLFSLAIFYNNWKWLKNAYFWTSIAVAALIAAPWHLYETAQFGTSFWQEYLGHEVLARAVHDFFIIEPSNSQYLTYLFSFAYPWPAVFVMGAALMIILHQKTLRDDKAVYWMSLTVTLSVLIVFFIAKTKAFSYLLPLYPFLALGIALSFGGCFLLASKNSKLVLLAALLIALGIGAKNTLWDGWHENPYYINEIVLAREEKNIGQNIANVQRPTVYVSNNVDLGSIIFYSGNSHPLLLTPLSTPAVGNFIIIPTEDRSKYFAEHTGSTEMVFSGKDLILLRELSEN